MQLTFANKILCLQCSTRRRAWAEPTQRSTCGKSCIFRLFSCWPKL